MSRGHHANRHPRRQGNTSNTNLNARNSPIASRDFHRLEGSNFANSSSYLADDENYPSFRAQLSKLGLELRDIPADGNCLFRALSDQLDGASERHQLHRKAVCDYIVEHRDDFEPFMEDDVPFDTHIRNLRQLGTYGGNEVIVAFCRLHRVNVVIHQLGRDPWQICGTEEERNEASSYQRRQLHISYHNGDHYSSVRKIGDTSETPSNIRIPFDVSNAHNSTRVGSYGGLFSARGSAGRSRHYATYQEVVERITHHLKNYFPVEDVAKAFEDCGYNEDETMSYLLQLKETDYSDDEIQPDPLERRSHHQSSNNSNVGIWAPGGTGSRIFGLPPVQPSRIQSKQTSTVRGRQTRANTKQAKKDKAADRRRAERLSMNRGVSSSREEPRIRGTMQGDEYIIQGVHAIQI